MREERMSENVDGLHDGVYLADTLTVQSLFKQFGKKIAVRNISFSMNRGSIVGLLGPNGAGKTTTFYMIAGFLNPDRGDVFLDDKSIRNLPMFERARHGISYLPQESSIFRKLTVEKNLWAILETRAELTLERKKSLLENLIARLGIEKVRKQPAYTLSGGERRRTEIARALAREPSFLLLDEPFAGIDPRAISEIKSIIRQLADSGIGILITDHNVRDLLTITETSYIVNQGEIVVSGNKNDILNNDLAREHFLGHDFSM